MSELILILFLVNLLVSFLFPNKRRLNLLLIFLMSLGLMIYLPYFLFADLFDRQIGFRSLEIALLLCQVGIFLGSTITILLFTCSNAKKLIQECGQFKKDQFMMVWKFGCYAGIAIALIYLAIVPGGLMSLPIIQSIKGADPYTIQMAREESFKLLDPRWNRGATSLIFYPLLLFRYVGYPLMILYLIQFYGVIEERDRRLGFFMVTCAVFLLVANGQRAPLPAMILRCGALYLAIKNYRKHKLFLLAGTLLIVVMVPPLIATIVNYGSSNIGLGIALYINRLTLTPFQDLLDYFNAFPRYWDFLNGQTLFKPLMHLFGMKYFYIENEMCFYSNPYSIESCHSNAAFLSNLWADFGEWGVFIGSFISAIVISCLDYTINNDKNNVEMVLYGYLTYSVVVLSFGSITSVLGTNGGFIGILYLLKLARGIVRRNNSLAS